MQIKYKLDPGAYAPQKTHGDDAGFDLRIPNNQKYNAGFVLYPGSSMTIDTGVHIAIPSGYCGLLVSKSGLNVKDGMTSTGLADAGYTGSIVVKLYNHGKDTHRFKIGDKVSQIVILPIPDVEMAQVDDLEETERGNNGFGSSGR